MPAPDDAPFAQPVPFPECTTPSDSTAEVLLGYLDFYRSVVAAKLRGLSEEDLRVSRLPSGWAPIELAKHLRYVERRWLVWGFEGVDVAEPWGDSIDDRWHVAPEESLDQLLRDLSAQAAQTRRVVLSHDLADIGAPGERWDGNPPARLDRILFHLLQEYARHVGHLDIVAELSGGPTGE